MARDFNKGKDPDLYTATPPLELLRVLVRLASNRKGRSGGRWKLGVSDVSRAYFYAQSLKPTFVEICPEDLELGEEHRCGELNVSMCGTRPAAGNWQRFYTQKLVESGFSKASSSTCIFFHPARHVLVFVHGDDFVSVGDGMIFSQSSAWKVFRDQIYHNRPRCRRQETSQGPTTGFEYEPDIRHAELIMKELDVCHSNSVKTLWREGLCSSALDEESSDDGHRRYRSVSARLNFLALGRIDLQFAAKECARKMARPTTMDWQRLKRVGRYLRGCPQGVISYPFQDEPEFLTAMSNANWAGDRQTRKSTSGGVVMFGQSWSKKQSLIALSSAESELSASVKCVSELLGIRSAFKDWRSNVGGVVKTDASAACWASFRARSGQSPTH